MDMVAFLLRSSRKLTAYFIERPEAFAWKLTEFAYFDAHHFTPNSWSLLLGRSTCMAKQVEALEEAGFTSAKAHREGRQ